MNCKEIFQRLKVCALIIKIITEFPHKGLTPECRVGSIWAFPAPLCSHLQGRSTLFSFQGLNVYPPDLIPHIFLRYPLSCIFSFLHPWAADALTVWSNNSYPRKTFPWPLIPWKQCFPFPFLAKCLAWDSLSTLPVSHLLCAYCIPDMMPDTGNGGRQTPHAHTPPGAAMELASWLHLSPWNATETAQSCLGTS